MDAPQDAVPAPDPGPPPEADPLAAGKQPLRPPEVVRWDRVGLTAAMCGGLLVLTGLGAAQLRASKKEAPRQAAVRQAPGVRVYELVPREVQAEVSGLGRVRPRRRVVISAQVGGTVARVHPELEDGALLAAGELALALDETDHRHALARADAALAGAQAEVRRLEAQGAFLARRIALSEDLLGLERDELRRIETLLAQGIGTERERERARLAVLRLEDSLLSLHSTQALLEPQLAAAEARVRESETRQAEAKLALERTRIALPFAGLLADVRVEEHQLISPGQTLFELWQVDRVEVAAPLPLDEAALLAPGLLGGQEAGYSGLRCRVEVEGNGKLHTWAASLRRFEPVDADTQTLRAVVEVAPTEGQPRLHAGVFCRVVLEAPARGAQLVLPVACLQERGRVYAVRAGRLTILRPELGARLGSWVVVRSGLEPGEQIVTSPLERVVEGLELEVLGTSPAEAEDEAAR